MCFERAILGVFPFNLKIVSPIECGSIEFLERDRDPYCLAFEKQVAISTL